MTEYSLFPSYVQIFYHSPNAPHVMTIPTRQWSAGADQGTFLSWAETPVDADTMITAFLDEWAALFPDVVAFDYYTIFNYPDEEGFPEPVAFGPLTQVGTQDDATTNWLAVQLTVTWQCADNAILKTVGMDGVAPRNFVKSGPLDIVTFIPDVVAQIIDPDNAWASRAGTKPLFGKQVAFTVNEALRKRYGLD